MAKNPLALVKERFGEKKKLVEAVQAFVNDDALWVGRLASDRGGEGGLARVSNAKLLKLHATFTAVKEQFGSRTKLVDQVLEIEKRTKDEGYKSRLAAWPVPRLYDHYKSAKKRADRAAAKPAGAKPAAAKPAAAAPAKAPKAAKAAKPAKKG